MELTRRIVGQASRIAELESGAPYHLTVLGSSLRGHAVELAAVGQFDAVVASCEACLAHAARALAASPGSWVLMDENLAEMVQAREVHRAAWRANRVGEFARGLVAFLSAELERPDQEQVTMARRASLLIDPEPGGCMAPQRGLEPVEARRRALGDPGPGFVGFERKARAPLR
jgi:hypothetical protein